MGQSANNDTSIARFTYTNDRLTRMDYAGTDYLMELVYRDNRLTLINESEGTIRRQDSVAYNDQGKVKAVYSPFSVHKVTWEGSNVKSYTRYSVADGGVETEYATKTFEYDNKLNFYALLFTDNVLWKLNPSNLEYLSANCVVKESHKFAGSEAAEVITYDYIYSSDNRLTEIKINDMGYKPVKQLMKFQYTKQ